jgi:hypothetical protein
MGACIRATTAVPLDQPASSSGRLFTFGSIGPIIITMSNRVRAEPVLGVVAGTLSLLLGLTALRWTDSRTRGPLEDEPRGPYRLKCPECKRLHPKKWGRLPPRSSSAWICRNPAHEPARRVVVEA